MNDLALPKVVHYTQRGHRPQPNGGTGVPPVVPPARRRCHSFLRKTQRFHLITVYGVVAMAVRLVVEDGMPYRVASWHLWRDHRVFGPFATIQNWPGLSESPEACHTYARCAPSWMRSIACSTAAAEPILPSRSWRSRTAARRFKHVGRTLNKLFSPNLEKALTFLDDSLLPATSNAVQRGFRRHRKMQKTVCRVRTRAQISRRIAVDMQRDAQARGRTQTTQTLHNERNGYHEPGNAATGS